MEGAIKKLFQYVFEKMPARHFLILAIGLAGLHFLLESTAYPVYPGRDFSTYIWYFLESFLAHPVHHVVMVYRTPFVPFLLGLCFKWGGIVAVKSLLFLLYVMLVPGFYLLAYWFNPKLAKVFTLIMIAYVPYCEMFHEVASENIFIFI